MLYDWTSTAALGVVRDIQPKEPLTLTGEGLWVCLISSGRCTASLTDASPSPAGSALILPPQSAAAGHLVLSRAPLTLTPEGESHLMTGTSHPDGWQSASGSSHYQRAR